MTWWKGLIAGVLVLAVVGITVAGLRDRPPPATEVQVAKVKKGTISRVIIGAGKVEASTTVKISSNLSGDLVERPVELGDKVKKGQVLGRIDPPLAAAKQAQAAVSAPGRTSPAGWVDRTKLDLDRVEPHKRGWPPRRGGQGKSDYTAPWPADSASRGTRPGRRLENAQTNLSRTTSSSPIQGTVIELTRDRRAGSRVRFPGTR
jgi:HlyD family secretion protein